jgi:nitroreductase
VGAPNGSPLPGSPADDGQFRSELSITSIPRHCQGDTYNRLGVTRLCLDAVKEEILKFLRSLRAVREYTPEAVEQASLEQILEVGRWSSTGGNRQAHEVIVVRDRAVKDKFAEWGAKPAGPAAAALLIVTAGEQSAFDEGRVAERMALAAKACGLGSCIATLKNDGPELAKQLLGIPAERRARTLVTIGHTDVEARKALPKAAQARKPMEEFAHWDRY